MLSKFTNIEKNNVINSTKYEYPYLYKGNFKKNSKDPKMEIVIVIKNFISYFRILANHILTIFFNIINKQGLTDAHTCHKAVNSKIFRKITLKKSGFSFCPELTTKLSNLKIPILEVPIKYKGRTVKEGKKIAFKDGIKALATIVKYKFFDD